MSGLLTIGVSESRARGEDDGSFALAIAGAPGLSQEEIMALATEETLARFAPPSMSTTFSMSLEGGHVVKASPGRLYSVEARLDATITTGNYYVQVHNTAAAADEGSSTFLRSPTKVQHTLGADDLVTIDFDFGGIQASAGIYVCISSTEFTKTLVAASASFTVQYT